MPRILEVRTYQLKPGAGAQFHALMLEKSLPMLKRWQVDVVICHTSLENPDVYCLMRAYASLVDRQQSQDAFYSSDEWLKGPREEILALIDTYTTFVMEADDVLLQNLRQPV